jgi:small basic protein
MTLDLNGIGWSQLLIAAAIVAIVDTCTGVLGAIADHTFNLQFLPDFLSSHVLNRVLPIAGAAYLGGVVLAGTSGGQLIFGGAIAGLGAYILAVLPSVAGNLNLGVGLPSLPFTIARKVPVVVPPAIAVVPPAAGLSYPVPTDAPPVVPVLQAASDGPVTPGSAAAG